MKILRLLLLVVAISGLAGILVFSVLYAGHHMTFSAYKLWLIIASAVWFGAILTRRRITVEEKK